MSVSSPLNPDSKTKKNKKPWKPSSWPLQNKRPWVKAPMAIVPHSRESLVTGARDKNKSKRNEPSLSLLALLYSNRF